MKRVFKLVTASLVFGLLAHPVWAQSNRVKPKVKVKNTASVLAISPTHTQRQAQAREEEALALFAAQYLSEQQLAIAEKVSVGPVACETGSLVTVKALPQQGKFALELGSKPIHTYRMVPVATDSGAIRLEDSGRGVVWLQLANKSMLLDQRQGRRLADACMNDAQKQVAREMELNPASHLLSVPDKAPPVKVAVQSEVW